MTAPEAVGTVFRFQLSALLQFTPSPPPSQVCACKTEQKNRHKKHMNVKMKFFLLEEKK
jgi:hypothetical protein